VDPIKKIERQSVAHCDIPRKPMSFAVGLGHYHIRSGKSSPRFSFINDKPSNGEMSDELDEIQADVTNGQSTQIERDNAFCARMRAAIAAGLESAPIGVVTTPGTKNPKYFPTDRPLVSSQRAVEHA
jgi:hypothetical protein